MISNLPERIFLSGFMGTGKTTVGKALARNLGVSFLDLDDVIEEYAGQPIRSVFEEKGEEVFREMERTCLLNTINEYQGVIALGGGTLQNQHVVDHVKLNGLLIFIETPISVILQRIAADPHRPLLLNEKGEVKNHDVLENELQVLYDQRLQYYEQAEIKVESSQFSTADQLVNKLIKKIRYHVSHY